MSNAALPVGFVGLGNMGAPMAHNLIDPELELWVYDADPAAMAPLVERGAHAGSGVGELAEKVRILSTCVPYDWQVREIFMGPGGIFEQANPDLVAIIHSTLAVSLVEELGEAAEAAGVKLLEAPISGARARAAAGTLTLMVGGPEELLPLAEPVISRLASDAIHIGPLGTGQVVKLANNVMAICNEAAAMEAVALGAAYGIDAETVLRVAAVSTGQSWAADNWFAHWDALDQPSYGHHEAGADTLPHRIVKDLRFALATAESKRTYLPVTALCSQLMPDMMRERWARNRADVPVSDTITAG